jgi:hypothetical protein
MAQKLKHEIYDDIKHAKHKIHKLHYKLTGNILIKNTKGISTILFYNSSKFIGYAVLIFIKNSIAKIDWIYGPGYGKQIMKIVEKICKRHNKHYIILNCSIDPEENIKNVMRRLNFYISLQYRVYNIKFRKKHGPLLFLQKKL